MKYLKSEMIEELITNCYSESSSYTATLSSICRQIAFAEGALFWFLYSELKVSIYYIVVGFLFLLIYFILDLIQYLIGYNIYQKRAKIWEDSLKKGILLKNNYEFPNDFFYWINKFLVYKLLFLFISSSVLIIGFIVGLFHYNNYDLQEWALLILLDFY